MSGPTVLVVGGGNEMFVYRTVACLASAGFKTAVASPVRWSSLRLSRHVCGVSRIGPDVLDAGGERAATAIGSAVNRHRALVVIPADLIALRACSELADVVPVSAIASPTDATVEMCNDKAAFGELLDRIDCPRPLSARVIQSRDDAENVPFDMAMIVKPVAGDGGIGVAKVEGVEELAHHMLSGLPGTEPPLLLQEFIPGTDIDCSFYAENGKIMLSAVQTRPSSSEATIEFVRNEEVTRLCGLVVREFRYHGLGHMDLRIDERDGSVRVIELNPRVWGSIHYADCAGANFPAFAVDRALGRTPARMVASGVCSNPPVTPVGVIRSLRGLGVARTDVLNEPTRRMFEAKHADPLPPVALALRATLWRLGRRFDRGARDGQGVAARRVIQRIRSSWRPSQSV